MMRQADFARDGNAAATDQPGIADRVVGRAKGTLRQQRLVGRQTPHGAVDTRGLDRLGGSQIGQDGRQTFGKHGFARTGWPEHQQIVRTGGGDDQCPLGHLLTAHVGIVLCVLGEAAEEFIQAGWDRVHLDMPRKESDRFGQRRDGDHFEVFDHGRFRGIGTRYHDAAQVRLAAPPRWPSRAHL